MEAHRWPGGGLAMAVGLLMLPAVTPFGCASTGGAGAGDRSLSLPAESPDALVQMRRSGCATEPCPVYGVAIFADGTVVYDGRANVFTIGQRRAKASPDGVAKLIAAIDAMDFLDTPDGCCACPDVSVTPAQPVILDYRPGSASKTVMLDAGCLSLPPAMSALQREIEQVAGVAQWTTAPVLAGNGAAAASPAKPEPAVPAIAVPMPESSAGAVPN